MSSLWESTIQCLWLRRTVCVALATAVGVLGLSTTALVAQVAIGGDGPQLLREQERHVSEEECKGLQTRIDRLSDPSYMKNLTKPLPKMERMVQAAKNDSAAAFERARTEAINELQSIIKDLLTQKAKMMTANSKLLDRLDKATSSQAVAAKKAYEIVDGTNELAGHLDTFATASNNAAEFQLRINEAVDQSTSLMEDLEQLNRGFVDSGAAKELGLAVSSLAGPLGAVGFKAAHLAIVAGVDALEGTIISKRDLPVYEKNLGVMQDQVTRVPLEIEMAQRRFNKYCSQEVAEETSDVPPAPTPGRTGMSAAKKVILIGGAAAGAAAIGVAAAGLPTTGSSSNCPTRDDICFAPNISGGGVRLPCTCPAGTSQTPGLGEIGCGPGETSGCVQCEC